MVHDIYVIEKENQIFGSLTDMFSSESDYVIHSAIPEDIDAVLRNIPSIIIINESSIYMNILDLCRTIRSNEDNSITPVVVVTQDFSRDHKMMLLAEDVQYIIDGFDMDAIKVISKNFINLLYKNRRISPLTGLPGNVQIQAEMKKRLLNKEFYAIFYFDLDNFKAYNDVYGFANGDEIIKFTARTITENIHKLESGDNFVGHIGGDDFVAVLSPTDYAVLCRRIIDDFDTNILQYYNQEDVERGYVEVANRKGIIEQFPLTTISIAVVEVDPNNYTNTLEIGEVGAQVKHRAKTILGSTYIINKRKVNSVII
ncbi:MAG: diguanylate cyclase [Clostridia bacterium]|nr:diguanylate cyclase [Clostridia bacterium]